MGRFCVDFSAFPVELPRWDFAAFGLFSHGYLRLPSVRK